MSKAKKGGPLEIAAVITGDTDDDARDEAALEAAIKSRELAATTMTGDIRDFILNLLRHEQDKRPWNQRSAAEQTDAVHRVEAAVRQTVQTAIEQISSNGQKPIKATLAAVTIKDGIKGTIELSKFDVQRHNLCDAVGQTVLIVVADADAFTGERAPVPIKPDQTDLEDVLAQHSGEAADRETGEIFDGVAGDLNNPLG